MMAVDRNGYITQPQRHMLQPAFSGIVVDVVERLIGCFAANIHSLYLYGSVATGRAILGKSDLDITIIFNHAPDQITVLRLAKLERELVAEYPAVAKIDFDCGTRAQALAPENKLSWGYWLKHHCFCLYGEDLSLRFPAFRPCKAIAVAINGDFLSVLNELLADISVTDTENNTPLRLRTAARKLIRSTNMLRDEQDKNWPETLEEYSLTFKANYPAYASEMDYLITISDAPQGNMAEHKKRIIQFAHWLDSALARQAAAEAEAEAEAENPALDVR